MAIALVDSVTRAGSGTSASIDTTGANLLVVVSSGGGLGTLSDSKSNTWTKLTTYTGSFGAEVAIYYVESPTVGTGHTFTLTGGIIPSGIMAAFSGAAASSFDQSSGANSQSSPAQPGSLTPPEDGALFITALGGVATSGVSVDLGFTIAQEIPVAGGANYSSAMGYLIQGTAAARNPGWTYTGDGGGLSPVAMATFLADAGGGGGVSVPMSIFHKPMRFFRQMR